MTKITTALPIMGSFCLGFTLLFNPCVAQEATPISLETPPQTVVPENPSPNKAAETALEEVEPEKPSLNEAEMALLKDTVGKYITAWQAKDYKTLIGFESWEGCALGELNEEEKYEKYKSFKRGITFQNWKITKVIDESNDQYKVLILISRNTLPPRIAAIVGNKSIKSTLPQSWKKQGDRFVHLFHIERKKMTLHPKP
jgi:hypothetical protein